MCHRTSFILHALVLLATLVAGCNKLPGPSDRRPADDLFHPRAVRIHPIFTKVAHWVNTPAPDGIDVFVELQDGFGDPTKAAGTFVFDLFEYDPRSSDMRGARVQQPWLAPIETVGQQRDHYDRTARAYRFQLESPGIRTDRAYVLSVQFNSASASPRVFSQLVLQRDAISR